MWNQTLKSDPTIKLENINAVSKYMGDYSTLNLDINVRMQVKEPRFYCYSAFHSHGRIFYNEQNSYPKMNVK